MNLQNLVVGLAVIQANLSTRSEMRFSCCILWSLQNVCAQIASYPYMYDLGWVLKRQ